jgi:hypothetical protein
MKKYNFQKIYRFTLLAVLALTSTNCSEDWLTPKPLSIYTPESAFLDPRALKAAITACDKHIRAEFYGDPAPLLTQYIFSDMTAEGMNDNPGTCQNLDLTVTPTSNIEGGNQVAINWYWRDGYAGIKYANIVIARINETPFSSEAEKNAILGAAYFHRAYIYYWLTQLFGDVPFVGREITTPKVDFYSTEREVILKKIKTDMEFASKWCTDNVDRGWVTKGACFHLLTKINLALGLFDDAITSASAVIDGGVYSLMTTPFGEIPKEQGDYLTKLGVVRNDVIARLHWPANRAIAINKEVLYLAISSEDLVDSRQTTQTMRATLPFWSKTGANMLKTPESKQGMSDSPNQDIKLVETFGRGIGRTPPTDYHAKEIWDDIKDLRHKKYNWMNMEDLVYNNVKSAGSYYGKSPQKYGPDGKALTADTICNWYGWPHYKLYSLDPKTSQPRGGAVNYYVYRLAETYLLRAEAYVWKSNLANAMADINSVHTRAGCDPYADISRISIESVLNERARELYFEEPRTTELHRISLLFAKTGKAYKGKTYSMNNYGTSNFYYDWIMEKNNFYGKNVRSNNGQIYKISPYHAFWCVPQVGINANVEGVINQNFGYDGYEKNVPPLTAIEKEDNN